MCAFASSAPSASLHLEGLTLQAKFGEALPNFLLTLWSMQIFEAF